MLKKIWNVVKDIGSFLSKTVEFILDLFEDLVYIVKLLGEVVLDIPEYLGVFPTVIVSAVISLVGIAVIFRVLGRE